MRDWNVICVQPKYIPRNMATLTNIAFDFYTDIEQWVRDNCHKSSKIQLIWHEKSVLFADRFELDFKVETNFMMLPCSHFRVKFRSKRDAVLFKLYFSEFLHTPTAVDLTDPIYIKTARLISGMVTRAYAQSIIGVQPIAPSAGNIFTLSYSASYDPDLAQKITNSARSMINQAVAATSENLYADTDSLLGSVDNG